MNKLLVAVVVMFSCGAVEPVSLNETEQNEAVEGELTSSKVSYVMLRKDFRRCAAPLCGGYWAKELNGSSEEVYVSALTFAGSELVGRAQQDVLDAPLSELIVRGRLSAKESRFQTQKLVIREAWRGLPGVQTNAAQSFFSLSLGTSICESRVPCTVANAAQLNGTRQTGLISTVVAFDNLPAGVSKDFVSEQAVNKRALVAGTLSGAEGSTQKLAVGQVFLKLPSQWSCPTFKLAACPELKTWAFRYDSTGCVVPDRCVDSGACIALVQQVCTDGYREVSFAGSNFGCTQVACEPAFSRVNR
jgi:hypothetical protein